MWISLIGKVEIKMLTSKYFNMGKVVVTHGINEVMTENNLSDDDKQANEESLKYPDDLYLLAAYETCKGKIWIITNRISENAGDNATTVCFPSER